MRLPGFDAAGSLYRMTSHYAMAVTDGNATATIAIPRVAAAPLLPGQPLPAAPIGPFPNPDEPEPNR